MMFATPRPLQAHAIMLTHGQLSAQTLKATNAHHRRATNVADQATREMERLREILRQCDELQNEFLKIKRIGEIVKGFRARVEALEQRIGK
jgi:hypothetical protein